jgi:sulfite exporter TauE/SafE
MLASITPLGERARGSRWGLTVAFYVTSAGLAGAALGAVAGLAGGLLWSVDDALGARAAVLAGALALGLALDLGGRLPTLRRQVNEDWLREYRGWVYGAGFGGQLGVGVTTIVTTSLVYATLLAALLSASAVRGAAIGAAFGLARGATLLAGARVRQPEDLARLHRRVDRWRGPVRIATLAAQALLVAALIAGAAA